MPRACSTCGGRFKVTVEGVSGPGDGIRLRRGGNGVEGAKRSFWMHGIWENGLFLGFSGFKSMLWKSPCEAI